MDKQCEILHIFHGMVDSLTDVEEAQAYEEVGGETISSHSLLGARYSIMLKRFVFLRSSIGCFKHVVPSDPLFGMRNDYQLIY